MTGTAADLKTYGFALAVLGYGLFALLLLGNRRARQAHGPAGWVFLAAIAVTAAWALAEMVEPFASTAAAGVAAAALDLARYALWFAFLLLALRPTVPRAPSGELQLLLPAALVAVGIAAVTLGIRVAQDPLELFGTRLDLGIALILPLLGMVLLEQLFRNVPEDSRWNAKPLCLGLAVIFAFDLYIRSEAVLFGRLDADALSIRGAVHLLAVPALFIAARRRADWIRRLQVSRSVVFYSATLLLAGAYLIFISAVGYYVRFFGGDWGRALQLGLLSAATATLIALVLSGSLRARLRVFVGKHFFSYRYDYREEWLRFTAMLSTRGSPQELFSMVIRGLADMVECPGGSLWMSSGTDGEHRQCARWNQPQQDGREPKTSSFCAFLNSTGWVIDIDECRRAPRRYGDLALPDWLLADTNAWLVVPLSTGTELLGFVTLSRPRTPMELNWEVRDLLKTASRQAASFLAQMQATEALLEARKFDAFNRMSAFVVHDLKNIVTQLSLMMKNAQRLHANPEFQQDMLLTVDSSLEKMRRLMLQLREGATPPGGARGVELAPILDRLAAMVHARGRSIETTCQPGLATRGHDERLERVLGHLVHNALDATPADGKVWVHASRISGQVKVEIGDNGAGMSEDFVQNKLFRPFNTTKSGGMGIGTYESAQYIRELGGTIAVRSQPDHGTVITLQMPLFDAHAAFDLRDADPLPVRAQ